MRKPFYVIAAGLVLSQKAGLTDLRVGRPILSLAWVG
jgi:hypothetical protein